MANNPPDPHARIAQIRDLVDDPTMDEYWRESMAFVLAERDVLQRELRERRLPKDLATMLMADGDDFDEQIAKLRIYLPMYQQIAREAEAREQRIENIRAFAQERSDAALKREDRSEYDFYQGFLMALDRILPAGVSR